MTDTQLAYALPYLASRARALVMTPLRLRRLRTAGLPPEAPQLALDACAVEAAVAAGHWLAPSHVLINPKRGVIQGVTRAGVVPGGRGVGHTAWWHALSVSQRVHSV